MFIDTKKLMSTGSQTARLNKLAKVHKKDISLHPVLSLTKNSYGNLNNSNLSVFFDKLSKQTKKETHKM